MSLMDTLIEAVYPPHCLSCGGTVGTGGGLCAECWRETTFLGGTRCDLCGTPLPGEADQAIHCDTCRKTPRPWSKGRAALAYSGSGRRIVMALKHGDRTDLPKAAAEWMTQAGREILTPDTLLLPVPLHWIRLFRRRYNQSALLAQEIARRNGLDYCPDALRRMRATPSQEGRDPKARFANVAEAVRAAPKMAPRIEGKPVVLIDDVLTSGATLSACADACLKAGASDVRVLVLARVVKET